MSDSSAVSRRRFVASGAAALGASALPQLGFCAKPAITLKVLSFNVWYGYTKKPSRKSDCLAFLKQQAPSVVSLQELNGYTTERLAADARTWGHQHSVLLKGKGFSTGFTSNEEITDVRRSFEGFHHGLMRCKTYGIYFYIIHLHPSDWEFRLKEVDLLLNDIAKLPVNSKFLLVGDFNTFSLRDKNIYDTSKTMIPFFKRLDERTGGKNLCDGRLDYRHITRLEDQGLVDLVHSKRTAFRGTFPTKLRADEDMGPERRLDYIFVSPNLEDSCQTAAGVVNQTTDLLSDHYPVTATFRLEGAKQ